MDCAIKIRNLESKLDSVVCTIEDRKELEKHVPMPSEIVVEYDKAASLWSLHEQLKQMGEAAQSSWNNCLFVLQFVISLLYCFAK